MAKGAGRGHGKFGPRREIFGVERGKIFGTKGGGRRRRVRRGLEIDLAGLSYTFPFLDEMQEVLNIPSTNNY